MLKSLIASQLVHMLSSLNVSSFHFYKTGFGFTPAAQFSCWKLKAFILRRLYYLDLELKLGYANCVVELF